MIWIALASPFFTVIGHFAFILGFVFLPFPFLLRSVSKLTSDATFLRLLVSGVNFNDGTAGGEILEGNLITNFVRESGDHGMFNSWDRQPIVHKDATGAIALDPATHQIRKNLIFNKNWIGGTKSKFPMHTLICRYSGRQRMMLLYCQ